MPFEPLKGLPTTAIVDPDGQIVAHHAGEITKAALETFLAEERERRNLERVGVNKDGRSGK